ncbi:hypothetical protein BGZ65_005060 [Modicella reniformis]|uniref:Rgp1-domain-containing protein n=1 Tax=Modicella reniformis TaxID=1440133 RepID=A0A9P6MGX0_9FUNG|nr:hypothetical protein BGZ65_005060 [Modicella reniformis]
MPISVRATFAQEGVFFAGEKLNCTITFTNSVSPVTPSSSAIQAPRPSLSLLPKLDIPHEEQNLHESNGNGQRAHPPSSNTQTNTGTNHERAPNLSPTSPSAGSTLGSPSSHSAGSSSKKNVNAPSNSRNALENGTRTRLRPDIPQQRPNTTASRALNQTRISSEISHIDVTSREHSEWNSKYQHSSDQEQEDQEDQEQRVAAPSRGDASSPVQSPPGTPTPPHHHQQIGSARQEDQQQTTSSPGFLGLASYMYRSASFSSLASAFGLSGGESEPEQTMNEEKRLPSLPPPEREDEEKDRSPTGLSPTRVMLSEKEGSDFTHVNPDQLARMGTPIGVGLARGGPGHSRTTTDGSVSGMNERMIELQVTDNADTQSTVDENENENEYQTPRPSMDYSTRSSMQSARGPFQHQYFGTPKRRLSLMSNYSTHSSSRHLVVQGSKKEALLWGSVQVIGQFMIDGSFIRQQGFEPLKSKTMYRPTGSAGGGATGGGTLGATATADWRDRANTYQIELPTDLPPSHRGKTIRFAYHLVVGVQRGSVHTPAKSVQLPFRLYNNISEQGTRPVYDLMSPVILHKDTAISGVLGQERALDKSSKSPNPARKQFEDYVDELIKNIELNGEEFNPAQARELTRRESDAYKDEETLQSHTCLEKVSLLSRCSTAGSYDICKNNVPVAKLSLTKTRFKLGETVHGIISFATREIPTYQISVTLETMEVIEATYACRSAAQTAKLTKRVHAELHESCIDTMRTSFALCIPPTATPEFKTSTLTLKWYIRVEFITGSADQPRFKMTSVDERRSQFQAVESLPTESFDCTVPIQVYPTSYETGSLFPPSASFSLS